MVPILPLPPTHTTTTRPSPISASEQVAAHSVTRLWKNALQGYSGIQKDVELCLTNAHRLMEMLEAAGIQTMLNELSSTVVFERPQEEAFVRKWQLACESDIAHVVVMPNISIEKLEMFVKELVESRERVKSKTCSEIHAH